jgi:hypothetical protein
MPLTLQQLRPKLNERGMLVGATGTGKTTLARQLLANWGGAILVIDSKCTYGGKRGEPGYKMVSSPGGLRWISGRTKLIQYRPDEENGGVDDYNAVYKWAYRRADILVYTDEAFLVHHGAYAPDWLRNCVTCGRELGIGMITGTQRPRGIDLRIMTEAEVFYSFALRHRDDRKRMAEMMGDEVMEEPGHHAFWFWRAGMAGPPAQLRLALGGEGG